MSVNIDFSALAQLIVNALLGGVTALVAPLPQAMEQWLLSTLQGIVSSQNGVNLLTSNPLDWTSRDSDVQSLFHQGVPEELGIATLIMVIQGIRVMLGRVEMYEAIMRTIFFMFVGESMLFLSDWILGLTNTAAAAVAQTPIDLENQSLPGSLGLGLMLVVAVFFGFLAWIKGAVGVVFIKVLIAVAPYFLTASALPILEGLGTWWAEEMTIWALRPFMVALALRLGLGLAAREGGPIGLLFTIVTFWLAYTMDTRIRRFSVGAWGSVGQLGLFSKAAGLLAAGTGAGAVAASAPGVASGVGSALPSPTP